MGNTNISERVGQKSYHNINRRKAVNAYCLYLVYGYCKRVRLLFTISMIIPSSIMDICLSYYKTQDVLIWFKPMMIKNINYEISTAKMDNFSSKLYDQQRIKKYCDNIKMKENVRFYDYGSCCKQQTNILPKQLKRSQYKEYAEYRLNIIFQCGGILYPDHHKNSIKSTRCCGAYIMSVHNNNMYNCKLPKLEKGIAGNNLIYDDEYGLISIGGYSKLQTVKPMTNINALIPSFMYQQYVHSRNVYKLSFKQESEDTVWSWQYLQNLSTKLSFTSSTIIGGFNGYKKKILTVGGLIYNDNKLNKSQIYDFETDEWSFVAPMIFPRSNAGIYHSEKRNVVYIGGGEGNRNQNCRTVEFYNIFKNKWYLFPSTKLFHYKPVLWIDQHSNNTLYIASCNGNMEYIDLRIGTKWNTVYSDKKNNSLSKIFCVNTQYTDSFDIHSSAILLK